MSRPRSTRASRELACRMAAQVCEGHLPDGGKLLAYVVFFENYIDLGAEATGVLMGWDVKPAAPVSLEEMRSKLKVVLS